MKNKFRFFTILFSVIFFSITTISCSDDEEDSRIEAEKVQLENYLTLNKITQTPKESGLYYIETQAGTGDNAETGKRVSVHYVGKFLNGDIFDSSRERNEPFHFQLGQGRVIEGWDEGLTYMKKGEKATFIIPSKLAYKDRGAGSIPPYTTLIFEVELLDIY